MMGDENFEQTRLYETPVVNGTATNLNVQTDIFDASHPLSHPAMARPKQSDPLLSPTTYPKLRSPTAYADAILRPFNGIDSPRRVSETSMNFLRSSSLNENYIRITVLNPQKEQQYANSIIPGSNTFVTYLITTRINLPEFGAPTEFSVRRRFRDVVTLADRLAESYRGYFIPPRPDKSVVDGQVMQKQDFLEQRRLALEKYLKRLSEHPVIKKSEELMVFLKVQGRLPSSTSTGFVASSLLDGVGTIPKQLFVESAVAPYVVSQTTKVGRDLLRLFRDLKQSVVSDWGDRHPIVEEDKDFLERKEKLYEMEQQLISTSQRAESLVKVQQDMGETIGDLGLAFIKLTKFETEEAMFNTQRARADSMKTFATAAVKASRLYRELNSHTIKHLDTLHEYLGLMLAVHAAFSDRSSALFTVQTLVIESSALHSKSEEMKVGSSKVFGGDKSRICKIDELKETIRLAEESKNAVVREYEYIKENNRTELERMDKERHVDFLNMLKGFVVNQVGCAEKIADVWAKVAEETSG